MVLSKGLVVTKVCLFVIISKMIMSVNVVCVGTVRSEHIFVLVFLV